MKDISVLEVDLTDSGVTIASAVNEMLLSNSGTLNCGGMTFALLWRKFHYLIQKTQSWQCNHHICHRRNVTT